MRNKAPPATRDKGMIDPMKRPCRVYRLLIVAGVTTLVALGGCSAVGSSVSEGGQDVAARASAAPGNEVPESGPMPAEGGPTAVDERKIIRVASIEVVVTDVAKAASDLRAVAAGVGGMVTAESLSLPEDASTPTHDSSMVVVSVPSGQLERALTLIAGIGEVRNRTIESTDVTDTVVDTESRIKTMRESIARLQELMSKAGSVSDIAKVESELTSRQSELEALLARLNTLNRQVELSPITVTLRTPDTVQPEPLSGFLPGLQAGWESLTKVGQWLLTALGVLLPYLGVAAVVGVPLVLWRRHRNPKQAAVRTGAAETAPGPGEGPGPAA